MQKSFSLSILKLAGLSAVNAKSGSKHYSGFRLTQLPKASDVITAKIIKSLEEAGFNVQLNYAIRFHQQRVIPNDPMYAEHQARVMDQIKAPEAWGLGPKARQVKPRDSFLSTQLSIRKHDACMPDVLYTCMWTLALALRVEIRPGPHFSAVPCLVHAGRSSIDHLRH
jgi:hypothetical protein